VLRNPVIGLVSNFCKCWQINVCIVPDVRKFAVCFARRDCIAALGSSARQPQERISAHLGSRKLVLIGKGCFSRLATLVRVRSPVKESGSPTSNSEIATFRLEQLKMLAEGSVEQRN